ncbi:glyoxalase, partial [Burkholderia cenocepacia]
MSSFNLRNLLRMTAASSAVLAALLAGVPAFADETHLDDIASPAAAARSPAIAVGPQYDTTHVCVAPEDFDRFTDSFVAT